MNHPPRITWLPPLTGTGFALLACLQLAHAAEPISLTRDSAIELALAQNPALRVDSLAVDRADAAAQWSGRLSNPELELSGAIDDFGNDEGEQAFEIAIIQDLPVTSRRGKQRTVSQLDAAIARAELQVRAWELAHQVDRVWVDLWAAEQSTLLQQMLLDANQEIVAFMEHQAAIGEVSILDTVQANLKGQLLSQELGRSQQEVAASRNRLRQLLGLAPGVELDIDSNLVLPAEPSPLPVDLSRALENQPAMKALERVRKRNDAATGLARADRWNDLSIKAFVERGRARDEPAGLENETMVGIGLSLPLPLRSRNQHAIQQAQLDQRESEQQMELQRFKIQHELEAALNRRSIAYELATNARGKTIPMAEQSFDDLKKAYESGQASLIQVQQAQAQLLELETSALELATDYHRANVDVRCLLGDFPTSPTTPETP